MALGEYGTTLLDELNRLANGGTYRAPGEMVGEALAARQWAVQRSVSTNLTDTVGVLNAIAGTDSSNRLDYSGVCNLIAGTFQLPAAQALRQITGQPAFVPYAATQTAVGTTYSSAFCSPGGQAGNLGYLLNTSTGICSHPAYGDPFTPGDLQTVTVYEYSCPTGGTYNPATGLCEQ